MNRRSFALLTACAALPPFPVAASPRTQTRVEAEIYALEDAWVEAEIKRDAETLRRILHEKFVFIYDGGPPRDRDWFVSSIVDDTERDIVSQELTERRAVVDGDTATLIENDRVTASHSGANSTFNVRLVVTYIRRKSRWLALSEYMHPINPVDDQGNHK